MFPRFSGHGRREGEDVDSHASVVAKQLLEQRGDGIGRRGEVCRLTIRRGDMSGVEALGRGRGLPAERGGGSALVRTPLGAGPFAWAAASFDRRGPSRNGVTRLTPTRQQELFADT